jgi:predicted MPP superfamily phosphohydrolase
MIDRLTWLHISDFHFTDGDDRFSQNVASETLLRDIKSRAIDHEPISFVVITGDIAFSGRSGEYSRATEFMGNLSNQLSIEPSRFFFVPGNHDIDRHAHDFAYTGAKHILTSQAEVDRALGDRTRIADLVARQSAYRDFLTTFCKSQERAETPDGLGYVAQIQVEPLRIAIVGLNSSWLCGSDLDQGSIAIGERQIIGAMNIVRDIDPHLIVALCHHPIEWLADWDQQGCRASLLTAAHFLHRGHMHEPDVSMSPHRQCVMVAAGSAHAGRFYPNSYNVVCLDLGEGISTIHTYTYRQEERIFEPTQPVQTACRLGGEIPGTAEDLAEAITMSAPSVGDFAVYMAALLHGDKDEIPFRIAGEIKFIPAIVAYKSDPDQAAPARAFLGLKNLLRLHRPDSPLSDRIEEHRDVIEDFGSRLKDYVELDEACRVRITHASLIGRKKDPSNTTQMPHTIAFISELRACQQWEDLESQARRSLTSKDPQLARSAKRALIEALIRSDEGPKRLEAVELGEELVIDPEATIEDYLLACAASESQGTVARSVQLLREALRQWPRSDDLTSYGRGLATRTGDASLRSALDAARRGVTSDE